MLEKAYKRNKKWNALHESKLRRQKRFNTEQCTRHYYCSMTIVLIKFELVSLTTSDRNNLNFEITGEIIYYIISHSYQFGFYKFTQYSCRLHRFGNSYVLFVVELIIKHEGIASSLVLLLSRMF